MQKSTELTAKSLCVERNKGLASDQSLGAQGTSVTYYCFVIYMVVNYLLFTVVVQLDLDNIS